MKISPMSRRAPGTKAALAGVALAALGAAGYAQARDNIYWTVGVGAAPGVAVGIGNSRPVLTQSPVYVQPAPIYVQPQPIFVSPYGQAYPYPVVEYRHVHYYQPAPAYYPGYVNGRPGHWVTGGKHRGRHWKHHLDRDD